MIAFSKCRGARSLTCWLVCLGALAATPARAADSWDIALGGSYALPLGDAAQGMPLGKQASGVLAGHLEGIYRFTHRIRAGLALSYGPALAGTALDGASDVSQWRSQFGVVGEYHFAPFASQDPWLGAMLSYNKLEQQYTREGLGKITQTSAVWISPASLEVRGGWQFKMSPELYVGPWLGVTLENYSEISDSSATVPVGADQHTWHAWIGAGLILRYGL